MFTTTDHHVVTDDKVEAFILDALGGFPVIKIGDVNIYPPNDGTSTWIRNLTDQLEDLAEQIDLARGRAIEQHMDDAIAAAGIGA